MSFAKFARRPKLLINWASLETGRATLWSHYVNLDQPGDGGCQCGNIRYRQNGKPLMLYVCHCSDCQKQSSSAFGMSLIMQAQQVEFIRGAESLRSWDTPGENGRIKRCHFCPACGTRVMHGSDDPSEDVSIKAGSLDDTRGLQPNAHIWLRSAQSWVTIDRKTCLFRHRTRRPSPVEWLRGRGRLR